MRPLVAISRVSQVNTCWMISPQSAAARQGSVCFLHHNLSPGYRYWSAEDGGQDLNQHWHTRPLLKSIGRHKIKRIIHVNTMAQYVSVPFFLSAHSLLTDFMATALNQCLLVALKYLTFELISAYIWAFATFFVNKKEKHSYHFWRQSSAFGGLECAWLRPRPLYFKKGGKKNVTFFCLLWFLNYFLLFSQCVKGFFLRLHTRRWTLGQVSGHRSPQQDTF